MSKPSSRPVWIAFIAALLAVGIPFWRLPYAQTSITDAISVFGMLVVFTGAALVRARYQASFRQAGVLVGLSVPTAIILRIIVEVAQDPTRHNLWPIEVAFGLIVGLAASGLGALVGSLLRPVPDAPR